MSDVVSAQPPILVQKYGGSSVADLAKIQAVAERIRSAQAEGYRLVVVVSAMGNTTNELLALAKGVSETPDRRELDMLISVGERITMSLLAMALKDIGVAAVSLTGSQSGIITDEAHAGAQIVEIRPQRIQRHLQEGFVVIVAGFQGVSTAREVTTLGRGGSDVTAVALTAALGAECCEICSDVDGVWSADPRTVDAAAQLTELPMDHALAIARGGARVLYEEAVRYARDHNIVVKATSTFGPGAGTRLTQQPVKQRPPVCVTGSPHLVRVNAGDRPHATLRRVAQQGARLRYWLDSVLLLDTTNAHAAIAGSQPTAMVTAVASGLADDPHQMERGYAAANQATSGQVRASGAHGDVVWWEVPRASLEATVKAVHDAYADQAET